MLHNSNELVDAHEILPIGQEHAAFRKRLLDNTEGKTVEEELTDQPITCRDSRAGFPGNTLVIDSTFKLTIATSGLFCKFLTKSNKLYFVVSQRKERYLVSWHKSNGWINLQGCLFNK